MGDDIRTKMRIQYALKERDARVASHIVELFHHLGEMLSHQSPQVLEGLIDYANEVQKSGQRGDKAMRDLRKCFMEYAQGCCDEAKRHERILLYGITGKIEDEN